MAIKTKATLASDLASILTNGGLLTALEDRGMRTDFIDSLACLLGTNLFVGDQGITGALSVSAGTTLTDLTASRILLSDAAKKIVSANTATYPSLSELAFMKGVTSAIQDQIDLINAAWTTVSFTAGDFTGAPGTWTVQAGDLEFFRYKIIGKTMYISLGVITSTTGSTPSALSVKIPAGKTAKNTAQYNFGMYGNASAYEELVITTVAAANTIALFRYNGATFPNGTNDQSIRFTAIIEIE